MENGVYPDPNKQAVEIIFSQTKIKPIHPSLVSDGVQVKRVDTHKHLGITLDSKLTFTNHLNEKIVIARKGVGIIKYLSQYTPVKTLGKIYKMFVRPHLDYCDVIYHIPDITNRYDSAVSLTFSMERLEKIQYQAVLAITGC